MPKALLPEGKGRDVYPWVQVNGRAVRLSARYVLCVVVQPGPVHCRTWPVLLCRRLCMVTKALVGPLHRVCCAAPSILCGRCRTAWCRALHCTVCAPPHCTCGQCTVGSGTSAMHCHTDWGSGQCNSCIALPHCLGAVGGATPAMQRHTATLPVGPQAVGSATPATHCHTACGQWAVELLQCTATLPGGSGRCNSYNAAPHCLWAVGSGTPPTHCHTASGQWAVELLQCTATLPGGSGQWNSY